MNIRLITVSQRVPVWVETGYQAYAARFPVSVSLQLVEVAALKRGKGADLARIAEKEAAQLWAAVPRGHFVVALTERGHCWDTPTFASQLRTWLAYGQGVSLLVGGPEGLSAACIARADQRWSLSALTFPHAVVRVIVAEQLYRALMLLQHHPYHR